MGRRVCVCVGGHIRHIVAEPRACPRRGGGGGCLSAKLGLVLTEKLVFVVGCVRLVCVNVGPTVTAMVLVMGVGSRVGVGWLGDGGATITRSGATLIPGWANLDAEPRVVGLCLDLCGCVFCLCCVCVGGSRVSLLLRLFVSWVVVFWSEWLG